MQIPIGGESDFEGVFDLVRMKAITWNGEVRLMSPAQAPAKAYSWVILLCQQTQAWNPRAGAGRLI